MRPVHAPVSKCSIRMRGAVRDPFIRADSASRCLDRERPDAVANFDHSCETI
jgi:hypothetical protein